MTLPSGAPTTVQSADLSVSHNQRYLLKDGAPFFYLCDTAWDLFMRLDRAEADEYLKNRAENGFNVIMTILNCYADRAIPLCRSTPFLGPVPRRGQRLAAGAR